MGRRLWEDNEWDLRGQKRRAEEPYLLGERMDGPPGWMKGPKALAWMEEEGEAPHLKSKWGEAPT